MAKVKFIAADPRDVPLPDRPASEALTVEHGDVIEVDEAHAKSLARQHDVWELVKAGTEDDDTADTAPEDAPADDADSKPAAKRKAKE